MARYLVTGGCGFIGSHLVEALIADGNAVRIVDNHSTGASQLAPSGVELISGDVRNREDVRAATAGINGCFHLAAVASVVRCNEDWLRSHLTNLSATVAIFEAARRRFPVVYASSAAVYGDNPNVPLAESERLRPLSAYGVDKAACEMHARVGATVHGLASVGLRFFNVYGPRQRPGNPYSGVISVFLHQLRQGNPLTIHSDGRQSRDFIYVADVVSALRLAMRRLERTPDTPFAGVYNVCTGTETTVLDLADLMMQAAGSRVPLDRAPSRPGDVRRSVGSPQRAGEELGFISTVAMDLGLRRLAGTSLA